MWPMRCHIYFWWCITASCSVITQDGFPVKERQQCQQTAVYDFSLCQENPFLDTFIFYYYYCINLLMYFESAVIIFKNFFSCVWFKRLLFYRSDNRIQGVHYSIMDSNERETRENHSWFKVHKEINTIIIIKDESVKEGIFLTKREIIT